MRQVERWGTGDEGRVLRCGASGDEQHKYGTLDRMVPVFGAFTSVELLFVPSVAIVCIKITVGVKICVL